MPLKMRPSGLRRDVYKDVPDYGVFRGEWCIGRIYETRAVNWPPFRPDTRHNLEGLRLSSSTGLCLTTTNVSN